LNGNKIREVRKAQVKFFAIILLDSPPLPAGTEYRSRGMLLKISLAKMNDPLPPYLMEEAPFHFGERILLPFRPPGIYRMRAYP
jgi:hypothetical protein